jgi:hypothetical protein
LKDDFFSFGKIMKKIIMVNVGFGETLGWNNIINSMITIFVSQQMKWFNVKGNGVLPWKPRFIPCQHHMVMVYVDHMLIHYEKSSPWKLHCLTTKDSYKITMQLYYNYHLEIRWFLILNPFQISFELYYNYTSIAKWILYICMYTSSIQLWSNLFDFVSKLHNSYIVQLLYN